MKPNEAGNETRMCVNNQNCTQQEVEEILQFLTQKEKTPLKALLAAVSTQALTDGGICVAINTMPDDFEQGRPLGPPEGGAAPAPGIFPQVWQQPDQTVTPDEKPEPPKPPTPPTSEDDGQSGMYL